MLAFRPMAILRLWILAALFFALTPQRPALAQAAVPVPPSVQELAGRIPPDYYRRAEELFKAGKKDDAVFVLYLGQLHFRTYLLTHREPDQSMATTTFATLSESIGKPIMQYALGDIPAFARTIDAVLAYDAANPDAVSSPPEMADAHESVRNGLAAMKAKMLSDVDRIRAQREKNGLKNRQ